MDGGAPVLGILSENAMLKGPSQPRLCFCLHAINLAIIFYSEPVETKKSHCETTQDN